jgi:DNA-binding beta-propeller fold protein YncE
MSSIPSSRDGWPDLRHHRFTARWGRLRALVNSAIVLAMGAPTTQMAAAAEASPGPAAPQWVARYDGPADISIDRAMSVAASPDGTRVYVTGYSPVYAHGNDFATLAYDAATGSELWLTRYDATSDDEAVAVGVSPDGTKVFVTGFRYDNVPTGFNYETVAYDAATGTELWAATYDDPNSSYDYATALAVSPDGSSVFVTGHIGSSGHGENYATVAYDAAGGSELWVEIYDGPAQASSDYATALSASPDGSEVFVTGYSETGTTLLDYVTIAYESTTGAEVWRRRFDGPARRSDYAYSVAVSPNGSTVYVTGYTWAAMSAFDYGTVAYAASTGATLWVRRFNGPGNDSDYAKSVTVSPDGSRIYVTGYSWDATSDFDYITMAYDAGTGALLWGRRFRGPGGGNDYAVAVAATPDGRFVYTTGYAYIGSGNSTDYTTVGYVASTGQPLGVQLYDGPGHRSDTVTAIAVSPDSSKVFVTGASTGTNFGGDYATVAYQV